jgi:hypothetical protein
MFTCSAVHLYLLCRHGTWLISYYIECLLNHGSSWTFKNVLGIVKDTCIHHVYITLGGALLGEGFGDRLAPQRVQDSARGRSPWELENIGPLF